MTARQPRRPRRRVTPAGGLPRPEAITPSPSTTVDAGAPVVHHRAPATRHVPVVREHHVTGDYAHVRKDLYLVAAVGAITLGFIVAMSFVIQ